MPTQATLMTVDEMRRLPEPTDGTVYELHHGELVKMTQPKLRHHLCATRLGSILHPLASGKGLVSLEFPFRALPEYDARRADVSFVSKERLTRAEREGDEFFGAPDLMAEVLFPSNTAAEMDDREALCFANGCREFWVVNPARETVKVTRNGESTRRYAVGERIQVEMLDGEVEVAAIFEWPAE